MSDKVYHYTITVIFLALGIMHAARLYYGWEAIIGGWEVPIWLSAVAVAIALPMVLRSFRHC